MNTVTLYTGPLRGIPAPRHGLIARLWRRALVAVLAKIEGE